MKKTTKGSEGARVNYSEIESGTDTEQIARKPWKNENVHPTKASTKSRKSSMQGDDSVKVEGSRSLEECVVRMKNSPMEKLTC